MYKFEEATNKIKSISDDLLTKMIDEIYNWHFYSNGCLDQNGEVRKFAGEFFDGDAYHTQDIVLREGHRRYEKLVKMLFINNPSIYIGRE